MQIITGKFRGRKLVCPKGEETRPTLGRVKESLFSQIADKIADARVLDLFAGSGAFGAECASRGARRVVLVDQDKNAQEAIKKNLKDMDYELLPLSAEHALHRLFNTKSQFDIIFLDPPYDSELGFLALRLIAKFGLLSENGIVVFETRNKNQLPKFPKSYIIRKERTYGTAQILILEQENE